jgi:nucleoside-diphosphate-sugar epimerase
VIKKQSAFITGSTGFIGSHLVRRLVCEGYDVHILVRKTSNTWRISDVISKVHCHYGDVTQRDRLFAIIRHLDPDYIFHLANIGIYGGTEGQAEDVVMVNLLGTINLIDASSQSNYTALINTGSSSEYGPKHKIMSENDSTYPQSVYAIAKLAGTNYAIKEALLSEKPITTLRIFSPYGPFDEKKRLIPYLINKMTHDHHVLLQSRQNVRDYVYIDDVVDAYLAAAKYIKVAKGKVINIGSGRQLSVQEVAGTIKKISRSKSKILWEKEASLRYESPVWRASIARAKQCLDWKPKYSFAKGIEATLQWHLASQTKTQ